MPEVGMTVEGFVRELWVVITPMSTVYGGGVEGLHSDSDGLHPLVVAIVRT